MKRSWFDLPFRVWTLEQNSGAPTEITSSDITDATNVGVSLLTSEDEESARNAIGAGTGNSNLEIGSTATTAASGNHNHAVTAHVDSGLEAASNIQALAQALSARIKALEDPI